MMSGKNQIQMRPEVPPDDFGGTTEEMCEHVARYPNWGLAAVVPVWTVVAFVSTWTARRIGNI